MNAVTIDKGTKPLSVKEQKFCDALLSGQKKIDAAIAAGYSVGCAGAMAARMQQRPSVARYLESMQAQLSTKTVSRREKIEQELERMAFFNVQDVSRVDADGDLTLDFTTAQRDQLAAVTSVSKKKRTIYSAKGEYLGEEVQSKVSFADKYRGLELLGRIDGMFKTEETKVTIDIADRLLTARQRLLDSGYGDGGPEVKED